MTAVRETLIAAAVTALDEIALDPTVRRMPTSDPTVFPDLDIFDQGQSYDEEEAGVSRYKLSLSVSGFVEGSSGADAHAALNELHAETVTAMRAEPLLGGLAEQITDTDMSVEIADLASKRRLAFTQEFEIVFTTRAGNPATI